MNVLTRMPILVTNHERLFEASIQILESIRNPDNKSQHKNDTEVFIIAPLVVPGFLELLIEPNLKQEIKEKRIKRCFSAIERISKNNALYTVWIEDKALENIIDSKYLIKLRELWRNISNLQKAHKKGHLLRKVALNDWPHLDMIVSSQTALLQIRLYKPNYLSKDSTVGFLFKAKRLIHIGRRLWALNMSKIPGIIDYDQLKAIRNIIPNFKEAELSEHSILTRNLFFTEVVNIYETLEAYEECLILNESARPIPEVLSAFASTLGRIRILWATPVALDSDEAIKAFLGIIVRIKLSDKINSPNNPTKLTITPITWEECKMKFVVRPKNKVVCGSPRDTLSYMSLRIENIEYIRNFIEHWNYLYLLHKDENIVESCHKLLLDYLKSNHINPADIDKTVLWKKIHEFSNEWNPQCVEYSQYHDARNMHLLTEITKEETLKEHIREMLQMNKEQQ